MNVRYFKKGFNYSEDGQGNRLIYHCVGCNLVCPWCANPEGMSFTASGSEISVEDLVKEAQSAIPLFFDGGGVTFTGGEPTMQFPALLSALQALTSAHIDTCIETNGTHPDFPLLLPYLSRIIIDCKHYDDERLRKVTGQGTATLMQNLVLASQSGKPLLIRTPLIDGFNAEEEDALGFVRTYLAHGLQKTAKFELLPYHEYGKPKWEKLNKPYLMTQGSIKEGRLAYFERVYRENGLTVVRT